MTQSRASRRRRRVRARPLLVAAGAVLIVAAAGCGVEPCHGICGYRDMTIPDAAFPGISPRDLAVPADLTPRGD